MFFEAIASATVLAQRYGYPQIPPEEARQNSCYMITAQGSGLDLRSLCQKPPAPETQPIDPAELPEAIAAPPGTNLRNSSGSTNRCVYPDDIAADGSRCGGRASTQRTGGR